MPKARKLLPIECMLEDEEVEALRWGHVPREAGDIWHAFMEGDCLYLRDVDTPHCTYWLTLERDGDAWRVAEAWASREFGEGRESVPADVQFVSDYLDWLAEHNAELAGPATRDSWRCEPMPQECSLMRYERYLTGPEHECVARGLVPETMEDRWFIFLEDDRLCFHLSWSGYCIYMLRLTPEGEGWRVAEAWVNHDPSQFKPGSEQETTRTLDALIDLLITGMRPDH